MPATTWPVKLDPDQCQKQSQCGRRSRGRARRIALVLACGPFLATGPLRSQVSTSPVPRLPRNPSLSQDRIAFLFADEIWSVPREGGSATQLTHGREARAGPAFSPDGQWIAYSAESGGERDLYVISAGGGEPRRVTWHPDAEELIGWSADGLDLVFSSSRSSGLRNAPGIYRARADGSGMPTALPLPTGSDVSFSPDGAHLAYVPLTSFRRWKGYRGGRAPYIWIVDLATLDTLHVPHTQASDWNPIWMGDRVFFLSDRDGPVTLFEFDVTTRTVLRSLDNAGFDFMSASGGPGAIVIDAFDAIKLYDPSTRTLHTVRIQIDSTFDRAQAPRLIDIPGRRAVSQALSPSGDVYAIEARGEIFLAPTDSGAPPRNVTNTPKMADRSPFWSADGGQLAYLSDASGEYQLVVGAGDGSEAGRISFPVKEGQGIFGNFKWAPRSGYIAYTDERNWLWVLDLGTGESSSVAKGREFAPAIGDWSPDGGWLAYTTTGPNRMEVAFLYSPELGTSVQVSDGPTDVTDPTFDLGGQYLYFLASADRPMSSTGSMAAFDHPVTVSAHAALLSSTTLPPGAADTAGGPTRVDTLGLSTRIVRLPAPARAYQGLTAGTPGVVYLLDGNPLGSGAGASPAPRSLWRVRWAERETEEVLRGVDDFELTAGGATAVVRRGTTTLFVPTDELQAASGEASPRTPAGRTFRMPSLSVTVDPPAQWGQVYHEAWRLQRDLFYAGNLNGLDLAQAEVRYAPFVAGLGTRSDLTYLLQTMLADLRVSHMGVRDPPSDGPSGSSPGSRSVGGRSAGLLGADYTVDHDRYRITRIYPGNVWLENGTGPLAEAGVSVQEGDFLIAVNGQEVRGSDNLDRVLAGTAGQRVELRVSSDADGSDAHSEMVTPVGDEFGLRHAAWIEGKRRMVDSLSGGRLAYVYVIDTGRQGYDGFNRQYLAQIDKSGVILDERNNGGGQIADYVIDRLRRIRLVQMWARYADESHLFPTDFIYGPTAMLVNEMAGSGGDILPYIYQKAGLGPVVGKRTWGGSIGSGAVPELIDGGRINVPHFPISDPDGTWGGLEGAGVTPDIVVDMDPKSVAAGRDPQLEAAVKAVLDLLEASPPQAPRRPPPRSDGGMEHKPPALR